MVYVVHIISLKGITIDLRKTKVVKNWPIPHSIKELRGFLWGFEIICKPLTKLLKKTFLAGIKRLMRLFTN